MSLTLDQCFGINATQTIDSLVIKKSDLPKLTPTTNSNAEALVVGILLKILENFEGTITDENGANITTENNIPLTYNQGEINDFFYLFQWRTIFKRKNGIDYRIYQLVYQELEIYL